MILRVRYSLLTYLLCGMRIRSFVPAILWFIISFILLTLPGDELPTGFFSRIPYFDKFVHLTMFLLLTGLFCYPFVKQEAVTGKLDIYLRITFYAIAYGIIMEFVQKYFVRNRSFDVVDILFDTAGSFTGLLVTKRIERRQKNRPR